MQMVGGRERQYFKQVQLCVIPSGKAEPGFDGTLASVYYMEPPFMITLDYNCDNWLQK